MILRIEYGIRLQCVYREKEISQYCAKIWPTKKMNYKDATQKILRSSLHQFLDPDFDDVDVYEQSVWIEILKNCSQKLRNSDTCLLEEMVNYLFNCWCTDAMNQLLTTEIPAILISFLENYVQNHMKPNLPILKIREIGSKRDMILALYVINECFKMHSNFNYQNVTPNLMKMFFTISEFSSCDSAKFAISIITRYAEHSPECLSNLLTLNFVDRILYLLKSPINYSIKACLIYALIPLINTGNIGNICELLIFHQKKWQNELTFLAILNFFNQYLLFSEKNLKNGFKLGVFDLALDGIIYDFPNKSEEGTETETKQTSLEIIMQFLNSPFSEHKEYIITYSDIGKHVGLLLLNENDNDIKCGITILNFLLYNDPDIPSKVIHHKIIENICKAIKICNFENKTLILNVLGYFLKETDKSIVMMILNNDILEYVFESIECITDPLKIYVLESLFHIFTNYPESKKYVNEEDIYEIIEPLQRYPNEDISTLAQLIHKEFVE
ncbi:hypothetical protein TRFO_02590 [Tritrichomonas foetus]|uniref:Uncharacterized protein n=1 Tax=Tritrichomonas foetus TaxID=1144522 RepID=A0A1J4L382_9EUKA|nr:hypothetical protein TRFO_02590 [Tritrichomonas foetus]|eukprot:OHT17536.1 hypothetical protein TRFO_02590 [Tritrichomonas foetus]